MKLVTRWSVAAALLLTAGLAIHPVAVASQAEGVPILISIDDLPMIARDHHRDPAERRRLTEEMLAVLARHGIPAVGLVTWERTVGPEDEALLRRWVEAGHELGNHSWGHLNYSRVDAKTYIEDVEKARVRLAELLGALEPARDVRFFRFPFLREGDTAEKLEAMRRYLEASGQRNLPVTLDNQDWSFEIPWVEARRQGDDAELARLGDAYQQSLRTAIRAYRKVGEELFERPVPQILLLHAGEVGAAQWDALFTWLKDQGFRFATADEVLADPAFREPHEYTGDYGPSLWDRLQDKHRGQEARAQVEALIAEQTAAWNAGDLEGFCAGYAEDALFVSPSGLTRGRQQVLDRYRGRYPDRAAMGTLKLEIVEMRLATGTEVSLFGDARPSRVHGATVVARWSLAYPDRETASGLTLIVFRPRHLGGAWEIVQDASM